MIGVYGCVPVVNDTGYAVDRLELLSKNIEKFHLSYEEFENLVICLNEKDIKLTL